MGYLHTGEIFENMLQLKRFSLYFEGIMNRKWLLSYRNNDNNNNNNIYLKSNIQNSSIDYKYK